MMMICSWLWKTIDQVYFLDGDDIGRYLHMGIMLDSLREKIMLPSMMMDASERDFANCWVWWWNVLDAAEFYAGCAHCWVWHWILLTMMLEIADQVAGWCWLWCWLLLSMVTMMCWVWYWLWCWLIVSDYDGVCLEDLPGRGLAADWSVPSLHSASSFFSHPCHLHPRSHQFYPTFVYMGSGCNSLSDLSTLLMWPWLMKIPTQYQLMKSKWQS